MAKLKLWCGVDDERTVFSVEIDHAATVEMLQEAIVEKKKAVNTRINVDPAELVLRHARTEGQWLRSDDRLDAVARCESLDAQFKIMDASCSVRSFFDEAFEATEGEIHVLVKLPPSAEERAAKRQRIEMGLETSLAELWERIEWKGKALPPPHKLTKLLQTPLPFRLALQGSADVKKIFQPDAPLLHCPQLVRLMNHYVDLCGMLPPSYDASSRTWQHFYDALLQIPIALCYGRSILLEKARFGADLKGPTTPIKLPDCLLSANGVVLLRGEERDATVSAVTSFEQLTGTMRRWNELLYGDLPYVVSYATSGRKIDFAVIERKTTPLASWRWVLSLDILQEKEVALKTFVNLAMLLQKMVMKTQPLHGLFLEPFKEHVNDHRTLVLTDAVIVRSITRAQCRNAQHFERLEKVYAVLEQLNSPTRVQVPYLQTVERFTKESWRLVVHLSPVGYVRRPDVEEVSQWLQHLLTVLQHWHERGFCHGDVQWRNIVFVPGSQSGNWMLIDMDESRLHETEIITWNHKCNGERLRFQHDLLQLGKLTETLRFALPQTLVKVQKLLLGALRRPTITAAEVLSQIKSPVIPLTDAAERRHPRRSKKARSSYHLMNCSSRNPRIGGQASAASGGSIYINGRGVDSGEWTSLLARAKELLLQLLPFKIELRGTAVYNELISSDTPHIDCWEPALWMDSRLETLVTPALRHANSYPSLPEVLLQEVRLTGDVREWTAPIGLLHQVQRCRAPEESMCRCPRPGDSHDGSMEREVLRRSAPHWSLRWSNASARRFATRRSSRWTSWHRKKLHRRCSSSLRRCCGMLSGVQRSSCRVRLARAYTALKQSCPEFIEPITMKFFEPIRLQLDTSSRLPRSSVVISSVW